MVYKSHQPFSARTSDLQWRWHSKWLSLFQHRRKKLVRCSEPMPEYGSQFSVPKKSNRSVRPRPVRDTNLYE